VEESERAWGRMIHGKICQATFGNSTVGGDLVPYDVHLPRSQNRQTFVCSIYLIFFSNKDWEREKGEGRGARTREWLTKKDTAAIVIVVH